MNIAVLGRLSRSAGGLLPAVSALCRNLTTDQLSLRVFGVEDAHTKTDAPAWGQLPVTAYRGFGPLQYSPTLMNHLCREDFDLMHLHGLWMYDQWASLRWHCRTDRPVIISPHGMLDPWALHQAGWKKKGARHLFAQASLDQATCLHALCIPEAEALRTDGLKNPIAIIPNGIDLPMPTQKHAGTDAEKQLLFLGRIHPKKGLEPLIDGWAKRRPEGWRLMLAGWDDGGHAPALRQRVEALGLTDQVEFCGPKFGADKDALLNRADAFVLPSFSEGLPMSILEAWAYECPVLMTDFCNLPEGFAADAALRIEPEAQAMADGLDRLCAMDDSERITMGRNGRVLVETRYTWPTVAAAMRAVYAWCLGGDQPACIWDG